jgi:hypothetical protein
MGKLRIDHGSGAEPTPVEPQKKALYTEKALHAEKTLHLTLMMALDYLNTDFVLNPMERAFASMTAR